MKQKELKLEENKQNMQVNTTIKQISNFLSENSIEEPREIRELQIELKNGKTSLKAMKTIVSMLQQGYDMSEIYSDVLKVVDSNNYHLKLLCSFYLKWICMNKPACQLMCTQSLLRDFNEINPKIQRLAILDSMILCDEILVKNYVEDLKRMCRHPNSEIRLATTRSLAYFYKKNVQLFKEEEMFLYLRELLKDKDQSVKIGALNALASIEKIENVVSNSEIFKIAKSSYDRGLNRVLKAALNVLKYKRLTDQSKDFYLNLLNSNDVCIFYLAASKLLENELFCQKIYESCLCFMGSRPEQHYNILNFILSFINKVEIDPSDFIIFHSEPLFIKKMKLKILFKSISKDILVNQETEDVNYGDIFDHKPYSSNGNIKSSNKLIKPEDSISNIEESNEDYKESSESSKISISEDLQSESNQNESNLQPDNLNKNLALKIIKREFKNTKELSPFIIYYGIYYNVYLENVFNEFRTEAILSKIVDLNQNLVSYQWKESISDFLSEIQELENPELFLTLIFKYSMKIPKIIFKYENRFDKKKLLHYYVEMRDRGVITDHQCYNYVKSLSKKYSIDGFTKLILLNLSNIKSGDIITEYYPMKIHEVDRVDFESNKGYDDTIISNASTCENIEKLEQLRNQNNETVLKPNNRHNWDDRIDCEINSFNEDEITEEIIYQRTEKLNNIEHTESKAIESLDKFQNIDNKKIGMVKLHSEYNDQYTDINLSTDQNQLNENQKISNSIETSSISTKKNESKECLDNDTHSMTNFKQNEKNSEIDSLKLNSQDTKPNYYNQQNSKDEACKTSLDRKNSIFPIYVDTQSLKGLITMEHGSIVLTVDILEKSQSMESKIGSFVSKNTIRSEGKFTISTKPRFGNPFSIKIGDFKYEGILE